MSCSVISRLWTRFQTTHRYTRRPGQGRSRCTIARQDRYLRTLALRNRQSTARALEHDFHRATGVHTSDQTIKNRLHEHGLRARRPARGPVLTPQHRVDRLRFARSHVGWRARDWTPVLFTDESRYHISTCDRRVRVWRQPGELYAQCNIVQHDRFGGGSVMVWDGISIQGRTELVVVDRGSLTAIRYVNDIIHPIVRPFAGAIGQIFILMHDNARPHTARVTRQYLLDETIEVMEWPARSPDLNPIEHVWDMISRRIARRNNAPQTIQELADVLRQEWRAIPQRTIRRLIMSMRNRCRQCIAARGGTTSY